VNQRVPSRPRTELCTSTTVCRLSGHRPRTVVPMCRNMADGRRPPQGHRANYATSRPRTSAGQRAVCMAQDQGSDAGDEDSRAHLGPKGRSRDFISTRSIRAIGALRGPARLFSLLISTSRMHELTSAGSGPILQRSEGAQQRSPLVVVTKPSGAATTDESAGPRTATSRTPTAEEITRRKAEGIPSGRQAAPQFCLVLSEYFVPRRPFSFWFDFCHRRKHR